GVQRERVVAMRRGELQEPNTSPLPRIRIARRKSQARTAAPAAPERLEEVSYKSPALAPSPSYGLCPAEEASADRRLAEKTGWTLSDLLDSLAERGRAPVLVVLAYG